MLGGGGEVMWEEDTGLAEWQLYMKHEAVLFATSQGKQ